MKKLLPLLPPLVLALTMITACQKASPPAPEAAASEQEIERRVQERLAQERQADQARALDQKNADLQKKERELADREAAWQKERDTREAQADAEPDRPAASRDDDAPPVVSNGAFYDSLAPYGQWLQIPGQSGYVWQPSVGRQDPNWRPYQLGRWAYTDQGWSWVSDEPFGWATYHYGRWTRLREAGWVWVPGDEWAPAWVSWRSSDDYVGWAPLPPDAGFGSSTVITYDGGYAGGGGDFSFVPYARFCEPAVATYIVAAQYNTTIINKTVNITNIVRTGNRSNVVINNAGPKPAIVQQKTGREVRPLQIRPQRGGGKSQISGNTLTVGVPSAPQAGPRQPGNVRPLPRPADPRRVGAAPPLSRSSSGVSAPVETDAQRLQRQAREREQQLRAQGGWPAATIPPQNGPQTVIRNGDQTPPDRSPRPRPEAERQQAQALRQPQPQQQPQPGNTQPPTQNPALLQQQAAQRAKQLQQQAARQQQAAQQQAAQQQAAQQQASQQQAARAQRQAERAAQQQQAPAQPQQPEQPQRERQQPPAQAPARVAPPAPPQPPAEAGDGKGKGQDARDKGR